MFYKNGSEFIKFKMNLKFISNISYFSNVRKAEGSTSGTSISCLHSASPP